MDRPIQELHLDFRVATVVIAPPAPWMNRAVISIPWLEASPQTAEAAVKHASPDRNIRRRPIRSPSRPASRSRPGVMTERPSRFLRLPSASEDCLI